MKKLIALVAMLALVMPMMAFAADFRLDNVGTTEKVHNLYVAGQNVNIEPNVSGDATVAASTVNINGNVEKSVQAAGSTVYIKGNVGDNLRVAGGTVNIEGNVGEDLVIFGGQVTVGKSVTIGHDIIVFGGTVVINGTVSGKVVGSVGDFTLNGKVLGDVDLKGAGKITLGNGSEIGGRLKYESQNKLSFNEKLVKGGVEFKQISRVQEDRGALKMIFGFSIMGLIGGFLLLLLLIKVFPKKSLVFLNEAVSNPWVNVGVGFIALFIAPIALLMLAITVVGFPIAALGFMTYGFVVTLAGILSSLVAGSWIVKLFGRKDKFELNWITVLVGSTAVVIFKLIPILGWLTMFGLFLLSLGTLTKLANKMLQAETK